MANERRSEVPTGPRDLELTDHIREVEKAAADWGVHVDALEGRFIGALLAAIRESGRTNLAVLGDIETLLERARATGEGELRRIGLMIEASQRTLSMAEAAAETSAGQALALVDKLHPLADLVAEVFALTARIESSVYDLFYLALARRTSARLLTANLALRSAASRIGVDT